jgi:hypothetical protein
MTMTKHFSTTAFIFTLLLGTAAIPMTAALADTSQNDINNATVGNASTVHVDGSFHSVKNGISDYDGFDRFRDSTGRPLPGWAYLFNSPG